MIEGARPGADARNGCATPSSTRSSPTDSRSARASPSPGPLEPWDTRADHHGFKGGDLLGIVERLDYLAGLGVTALYLTPIFSSASNHRYHTYDYFEVDPLLGGDDALRELLDACHARGMRVVLDGVFNHSGRGFWPFHHVVENGASSPYVDWFYVDRAALAAGQAQLRPYSRRRRRSRARRVDPGERRSHWVIARGGTCRRCQS